MGIKGNTRKKQVPEFRRLFEMTLPGNKISFIAGALVSVLALLPGSNLRAQTFPDTLWIPVIFYDYHGLGTNGFQPTGNCNYPDYRDMVQNKLYAITDFKPVRNRNVGCNQYLNQWYRPSGASGSATNTEFYFDEGDSRWKWTNLVRYNNPLFPSNRNEYISTQYNADYLMANIVIYDSLPFLHRPSLGEGTYQFSRTGEDGESEFFWLDGKGFGNSGTGDDGRRHNFYFTMELHWEFTYKPGLVFDFQGDDDVWAFVNDSLVMDLGGIHEPLNGSFNVDDFASRMGLVEGRKYPFRFFYAERKTSRSTIRITTNILLTTPGRLELSVTDATVRAGEYTDPMHATLFSTTGERLDSLLKYVSWYVDPLELRPGDALTNDSGGVTRFTATEAHRVVNIIARYTRGGIELRDTARVTVLPGPAHRLWIEDSNGGSSSRNTPVPIGGGRITLSTGQSSTDDIGGIFAILRDRFGNYVGPSTNTEWRVVPGGNSVVTAEPTIQNIGRGRINKVGYNGVDSVSARTLMPGLEGVFPHTIRVTVDAATYSALRIVLATNRTQPVTSHTMTTQDTTVFVVQGLRDDGQWVEVTGTWSVNPNLRPRIAASTGSMWAFSPQDTGNAVIQVTGHSRTASVQVRVNPGPPRRLEFYPHPGQPIVAQAYPRFMSFPAGDTLTIYAKIFDQQNIWLSVYETDPNRRNEIRWTLDNENAGSIVSQTGTPNRFVPRRAGQVVSIIATLPVSGMTTPPTATITITILPGAPSRIRIVEDTTSHVDLSEITMARADSIKRAFTVVEDRLGNYISYAFNTDWQSRDTTAVGARKGNTLYGEGLFLRAREEAGAAWVIATYTTPGNVRLFDSVLVRLSAVTYDSLRIVNSRGQRVDSLNLSIDQRDTLFAQARRSDGGGWVTMPVAWSKTADLITSINPPLNGTQWTVQPTQPGTGTITISREGTIPYSIPVKFLPGTPSRLVLYPREGQPGAPDNPPFPPSVNAPAGTPLPMVSKIFDRTGVWLADYELTPSLREQISWVVPEAPGTQDSSGTINRTTGHRVIYTPIKAHRQVTVIASLGELRDTLVLNIVPGREYRLYIESSSDWLTSPHRPNPIDTVKIPDSTLTGSVYAVVRDSIGNFVRFSDTTSWGSLDINIVTVEPGWTERGEGVINRDLETREGITRVYARDKRGFTDTVWVQLLPYRYRALRIVAGSGTVIDSGADGRTLTINTNQTATLIVQGLRSDTTLWENVPGNWSATGSLRFDRPPPANQPVWAFSPTDTGSGFIKVTLGDAQPDSVRTIFTPGAPTRVTMEIITPPDQRIAGEPITAVIKLYNQNGLYPDTICLPAYYQDTLGTGGRDSIPYVIIGDTTVPISKRPDSLGKVQQCFAAGVDTVRFILFYAPADTMHRLYANIGGLQASTPPFLLHPGALDTILLTVDGRLVDTLVVRPGEPDRYIRAVGYDRFGNLIGTITSNWSVDGTLHEPTMTTSRGQIPYGAGNAVFDEKGNLIATASDNSTISGRLPIMVLGPLAQLVQATTRDRDGNGYLDALELRFDLPLDIRDSSIASGITAIVGSDTLRGISITPLDTTGKLFLVTLREKATTQAQTGWLPRITIDNRAEKIANAPPTLSISGQGKVVDGAGPVIWQVIKYVENPDDRTKDRVVITFSEPVLDSSGVQLRYRPDAIPPESLLYVWVRTVSGSDSLVPAFAGIADIIYVAPDQIEIIMTNGFDLTAEYRVSIRVDTTEGRHSEITDNARNFAHVENAPVRVQVKGKMAGVMVVGPNPMSVTTQHGETSLNLRDPRQAFIWALTAGTAFEVKILMPGGPDSAIGDFRVTGQLQIYDMAGNLVYRRENLNDLIPPEWRNQGGEIKRLVFYWNGMTDQNRKSAPGAYRAILRLKTYPDRKEFIYKAAVGIRR